MSASDQPWTPNLVMPGVAKCGTTTIHDLLVAHPRVTGGIEKEIRFLMDPEDDLATPERVGAKGLEGWAAHFPDNGRGDFDVWVDASPQYQYQAIALPTIASLDPAPRVLFVTRDPSQRLFSMYQYARYHQRAIPQIGSFAAFVKAIRPPVDPSVAPQRMLLNAWRDSHYDESIVPWVSTLPKGRVKVLRIEDFAHDRTRTLTALANWLQIDPAGLLGARVDRSNQTVVTRSRLLFKVGGKLARALPDYAPVRALKAAVRQMNSGKIDRSEVERNASTLEEIRAEFAGSTDRLVALDAFI